jgi:hypothetical protein
LSFSEDLVQISKNLMVITRNLNDISITSEVLIDTYHRKGRNVASSFFRLNITTKKKKNLMLHDKRLSYGNW